MTEPTDTSMAPPDEHDWLGPSYADSTTADSTTADSTTTDASRPAAGVPLRRVAAVRGGLLVAGGVIGALVVTTLHHGGSATASPTTTSPAANVGPQFGGNGQPGVTGQIPGGAPNGGFGAGGRSGEQHLTGTLTAIGASSVTVRTAGGTATYVVDSSTQIIRGGSPITLSALEIGEPVFMHVYPASSGSRMLIELLLVGPATTTNGSTSTNTITTTT